MKFFKNILLYLFFYQILISGSNQFDTRISFLNFGLDLTKYTDFHELHRSILMIPVNIEIDNFEVGLYLTPFNKEVYDGFGNYVYNNLIDSYLVNLRLRYSFPVYRKFNGFVDLGYCDGNTYKWKDLYVLWSEVGVYYRLNYTTKLFIGYKKTINTNDAIDINSIFINLIFGHSFLRI